MRPRWEWTLRQSPDRRKAVMQPEQVPRRRLRVSLAAAAMAAADRKSTASVIHDPGMNGGKLSATPGQLKSDSARVVPDQTEHAMKSAARQVHVSHIIASVGSLQGADYWVVNPLSSGPARVRWAKSLGCRMPVPK
jgi:hypothetical protein